MSREIRFSLPDDDASKLERLARALRRTAGETARLLLGEKLREEEFPYIEFRQTHAGRLAYLKGSRLAVWQIALVSRDTDAPAELLGRAPEEIASALAYAEAYLDEIDPLVEDTTSATFEAIRRLVPWAEEVRVPE